MLYTNFVGTPTLLISIDEERSIIVPDAAAVLIQIVIIVAEYDIKYLFTNSFIKPWTIYTPRFEGERKTLSHCGIKPTEIRPEICAKEERCNSLRKILKQQNKAKKTLLWKTGYHRNRQISSHKKPQTQNCRCHPQLCKLGLVTEKARKNNKYESLRHVPNFGNQGKKRTSQERTST